MFRITLPAKEDLNAGPINRLANGKGTQDCRFVVVVCNKCHAIKPGHFSITPADGWTALQERPNGPMKHFCPTCKGTAHD